MPRYAPTASDPTGVFAEWELQAVAAEVNAFLSGRRQLREDAEDIFSECLWHWYKQRGRYTPSRSASERTFLNSVIRNKLRDLLDHIKAGKERINRNASSLDVPIDDADSLTLADVIVDEDLRWAPEAAVLADELGEAIDRAARHLAEPDREIVERLRRGETMTEISRGVGRSRSTIYNGIDRIRAVFQDEGLAVFLD